MPLQKWASHSQSCWEDSSTKKNLWHGSSIRRFFWSAEPRPSQDNKRTQKSLLPQKNKFLSVTPSYDFQIIYSLCNRMKWSPSLFFRGKMHECIYLITSLFQVVRETLFAPLSWHQCYIPVTMTLTMVSLHHNMSLCVQLVAKKTLSLDPTFNSPFKSNLVFFNVMVRYTFANTEIEFVNLFSFVFKYWCCQLDF